MKKIICTAFIAMTVLLGATTAHAAYQNVWYNNQGVRMLTIYNDSPYRLYCGATNILGEWQTFYVFGNSKYTVRIGNYPVSWNCNPG